ncbi:cysteine synthase A [Halorientalis sp. IM1011]|uniref:cysteine synthase A n=1 Tax=Halorientalis sp. IM1011 TaxID=1932360 RepID=UPI00097CC756|nr:cysteine synthase A [Halorientalis sp. IM1011]AQL42815.1 cysteine synthase A [Halorientalis sp. IM1011]
MSETTLDDDERSTAGIDAADSATELVGETPLVDLSSFAPNCYAKVEAANPFSVKDRIAREMVEQAEREELVDDGTHVIEATSGNTGIGLAFVCAAKGYDLTLTMPESMSEERRQLLSALGATLELTPADGGMGGAIDRAEELQAEADDAFVPRQFENDANPRAHRETTGPEIWAATDGAVDAVVAGVGTGGTITGVSKHIEGDRGASLRSVAVEPAGSPILSKGEGGSHGIQGIGPSFVPDTLDPDVIDEVRTIHEGDAKATARRLAREAGLLVGISSGAAAAAGFEVARDYPDEVTVVILPDTGERYLSTGLFAAGDGS